MYLSIEISLLMTINFFIRVPALTIRLQVHDKFNAKKVKGFNQIQTANNQFKNRTSEVNAVCSVNNKTLNVSVLITRSLTQMNLWQ